MSLRLSNDGRWDADQFSAYFRALERLYLFFSLSTKHRRTVDYASEEYAQELFQRIRALNRDGSISFYLGRLATSIENARDPAEFVHMFYAHWPRWDYYDLHLHDRHDLYSIARQLSRVAEYMKVLEDNLRIRERSHRDPNWHEYRRESLPELLTRERIEVEQPLSVSSIQYASPGFTDVTGVGQVLGHVKDLITKLLEMRASRDERKLRNRLLEQQVEEAKLKNIEKKIDLLKKMGYSDTACQILIGEVAPSIMFLEEAVSSGLITNVTIIKENDG